MNGFVLAAVIMIGVGFVGILITSPVLEFLEKKNKIGPYIVDIVSSILCGTFSIGMLMMGTYSAITRPQSPDGSIALIGLGGMAAIGAIIMLVIAIREHRSLQTPTT